MLWNAAHGSSREAGCAALTHHTSLRHAELSCRVWYEFVASKANPADAPSRGDFSFLVDWVTIEPGGPFVWFDSVLDPSWAGLW